MTLQPARGRGEILAIDPGMTYTGWSRFLRLEPGEIHPDKIKAAYRESGRVHMAKLAPPAWPLEQRLPVLAEWVRGMIARHPLVQLVGIEKVRYAGAHKDRAARQTTTRQINAKDLELLNLAIGGLVVAVHTAGVAAELLPVFKPKLQRLHIVRGYWPQFQQLDKPNDESDAVYLGLCVATTTSRVLPRSDGGRAAGR